GKDTDSAVEGRTVTPLGLRGPVNLLRDGGNVGSFYLVNYKSAGSIALLQALGSKLEVGVGNDGEAIKKTQALVVDSSGAVRKIDLREENGKLFVDIKTDAVLVVGKHNIFQGSVGANGQVSLRLNGRNLISNNTRSALDRFAGNFRDAVSLTAGLKELK